MSTGSSSRESLITDNDRFGTSETGPAVVSGGEIADEDRYGTTETEIDFPANGIPSEGIAEDDLDLRTSDPDELDELDFQLTATNSIYTHLTFQHRENIENWAQSTDPWTMMLTSTGGGTALMALRGATPSDLKYFRQGEFLVSEPGSIDFSYRKRRSSGISNDYEQNRQKIQTTLDAIGFVPGYGEIADLLNGGIYVVHGEYKQAGISFASAIGGDVLKGFRYVPGVAGAAKVTGSFVMSTTGGVTGSVAATGLALFGLVRRGAKAAWPAWSYIPRAAKFPKVVRRIALKPLKGQLSLEHSRNLADAVSHARAGATTLSNATFKVNFASVAVKVGDKVEYLVARSFGKVDDLEAGLKNYSNIGHSEDVLIKYIADLRAKHPSGKSIEILAVFSERKPCPLCEQKLIDAFAEFNNVTSAWRRPPVSWAVEHVKGAWANLRLMHLGMI